MNKSYFRARMLCAAAAVLLTGLSSTVFVTAQPRVLEQRISAHALALTHDRAQPEAIRTTAALQPSATTPAG